MESTKQVPFTEAILKAKVAQICGFTGFHAITQDSSNILVDVYKHLLYHFARHCKDAANNNRRVESNIIDLVQAFDFVNFPIDGLQEYIETVKLPWTHEITKEEPRPSKGIQRNLFVDDLLEAEKNNQQDDHEDGEKAQSENGIDEDEKPNVTLLKDTYSELSNKFLDCTPVAADKKIRLGGRILLVANTKLKISTPIPPEPTPSTSGLDMKSGKRKKGLEKKKSTPEISSQATTPIKKREGKKRKNLSREFILPEPKKTRTKTKAREKEKGKIKAKLKTKKMGREIKRTKSAVVPLDPAIAEPPSFLPLIEPVQEPVVIKQEKLESPEISNEAKGKRKKRSSEEILPAPIAEKSIPIESKEPTKGRGRKKTKTINTEPATTSTTAPIAAPSITPLDPSIAEPPSFFPILESQPELVSEVQEEIRLPTPQPTKTPKGKKKKKSSNQFAIVTETVTAAEDKEWFCPACGGPDDGDLMVQCDLCEEWYHLLCTGLKKPPEDDENWECEICINKAKAIQKAPPTPVVEVVRTKTPEQIIKTPQPTPPLPHTTTAGTSQDDLCPECNLPDDGTMMIQCDDPFCAKWFHGKCVSLLEEPKEDESWFCKVCVDKQQSAFKRRRRAK